MQKKNPLLSGIKKKNHKMELLISHLLLCFNFSLSLSFLWSLCLCSLSLCLSLCLWESAIQRGEINWFSSIKIKNRNKHTFVELGFVLTQADREKKKLRISFTFCHAAESHSRPSQPTWVPYMVDLQSPSTTTIFTLHLFLNPHKKFPIFSSRL